MQVLRHPRNLTSSELVANEGTPILANRYEEIPVIAALAHDDLALWYVVRFGLPPDELDRYCLVRWREEWPPAVVATGSTIDDLAKAVRKYRQKENITACGFSGGLGGHPFGRDGEPRRVYGDERDERDGPYYSLVVLTCQREARRAYVVRHGSYDRDECVAEYDQLDVIGRKNAKIIETRTSDPKEIEVVIDALNEAFAMIGTSTGKEC